MDCPFRQLRLARSARGTTDKRRRRKPKIIFIMGDDVGWLNIGA